MAKKIKPCPGWLATFADLMSLLMAVFVLLFAMSTLDEVKYKAIVISLTYALGHGRDLSLTQVEFFQQLEEQAADLELDGVTIIEDLKPLYESLIETYATKRYDQDIEINFDPERNEIKVSFSEIISFPSGQATLKPELIFMLRKLHVYMTPELSVTAVGHTDKVPLRGGPFGSNWGLSSVRAAKVIDQLVRDGVIDASQGRAVGMAETRPLVDEDTPEAFAKNRRVEILLMPKSQL